MELSALGRFMRESNPWTYPVANLLHVVGVAALFGSVVIMDLRLLGMWRDIPLAPLTRATAPMAALGFGVAATTGVGLLSANATEYAGNGFLLIKFTAIPIGFVNAVIIRRSAAWRARVERALSPTEERRLSILGGVSLISWLTAVVAGRMIAYW